MRLLTVIIFILFTGNSWSADCDFDRAGDAARKLVNQLAMERKADHFEAGIQFINKSYTHLIYPFRFESPESIVLGYMSVNLTTCHEEDSVYGDASKQKVK